MVNKKIKMEEQNFENSLLQGASPRKTHVVLDDDVVKALKDTVIKEFPSTTLSEVKGNRGDEDVMGRYDLKERNVEGQLTVDFAKRMEMAVVNTYIKKDDHRVTYTSGGSCTQVDYVLCRRCNLKEIEDYKVLAGDSVARQHRMVVCRMVLEAKKRRSVRTERRIRWWKLKEECSVRFWEEVRQGLGGGEEVLDD
ncbi:hypothetical protein C0J45_11991 [Silurus meridionalis]|nr:hypothetical protein C0J45_11991 [Silurus meridionalis]